MKILTKENKEVSSLDLGILEAGQSKKYEYYLYNEAEVEAVDIKVEIEHKEVFVLSAPKKLNAGEKQVFSIEWKPTLTIKKGLQTLIRVNAVELYR